LDHRKILRASGKLQNHEDFKNIYINRDMTPLERDQWRILVKLKKDKQEQAVQTGEDATWIIRSGKVVKGRRAARGKEEGENE
jgi:hypothetical protein